MNKKIRTLLALALCLVLILFLLVFSEIRNISGKNQFIDLIGNNEYWKASLNINVGHDSELIIQPRRDDFFIPSEITVSIIQDEEIIYSNNLQYIPNEFNSKFLGSFMTHFNSGNLKGNGKKITLNISYNNTDFSILLK